MYALTSDLNPSVAPFHTAKDKNTLLKAGTAVTVVAECTNALDEEWCEITYGSQKNLFVSKASLKLVADTLMPSFVSVKTNGKVALMSAPFSPDSPLNSTIRFHLWSGKRMLSTFPPSKLQRSADRFCLKPKLS